MKREFMSDYTRTISTIPTVRRTLMVFVSGAALLTAVPALAASPAAVHHHHASEAAQLQRETVEQRIHTLHTDLGITATQEPDWEKVAAVMRRNESTMRSMVAERRQTADQTVTAVDDLVVYEKFNQAHVDGLKDLIASFQVLYQSMPDAQKAVADHVFRGFGRERPLHG
jgi:trehalose/maltose hydrolase-like predicted phosphorylase